MYTSEGNVRSSLHIIPLSHMIKCRQGSTHSKPGRMNTNVFFPRLVSGCNGAGWGTETVRSLMSNLQILKTLKKLFRLRPRIKPQWPTPQPITTLTELPTCYSTTFDIVDDNGMHIFVFFGLSTVLTLLTCVNCTILIFRSGIIVVFSIINKMYISFLLD
jgi:hypothetical protein